MVWEADTVVPSRELQVHEHSTGKEPKKLLLDGQQRLTSLAAVIRGRPIQVRGRKRPIDILFNLEHPDRLEELIEVEGDEESPLEEDDVEESEEDEDEEALLARLQKRSFVVASKQLAQLPNWVSVTDVFRQTSDAPFLKKATVTGLDDPRYEKYTQRLQRLRQISKYPYEALAPCRWRPGSKWVRSVHDPRFLGPRKQGASRDLDDHAAVVA